MTGGTSTIILLATLVPALLALVVITMLVAICVCKKILKKKQNQLEQEVYYSVIGPPALPDANVLRTLGTHPTEDNQAKNPAYGMSTTAISDQGIKTNTSEHKLRNLNFDCRTSDTVQLSSNPAYGTNVSIAPEIGCKENLAYEQRDPNVECRNTVQLSFNSAYGTNVAIAPEIDCEVNTAYEQRDPNAECRDTMLLSSSMAIALEIDCEENLAYERK